MKRLIVSIVMLAFCATSFAQNGPGNITQVLADLQAQIDALEGRVSQNDSDISTNASNVASNATDISTNAANIATNAAGISTNASNVASNATDISTNATGIAQLYAVANATLEERVSGKTFIVRSTGHGSGGTNPVPQDPRLPESGFFSTVLENTQRDFSVAEGNLVLNSDGRYNLDVSLSIIILNSTGFYLELLNLPISAVGDWMVVPGTNEIVLESDNGEVQRLQSTPSGEVLTTMSNDQRLVLGDPTNLDGDANFFNTYIADAVYIQLPGSS